MMHYKLSYISYICSPFSTNVNVSKNGCARHRDLPSFRGQGKCTSSLEARLVVVSQKFQFAPNERRKIEAYYAYWSRWFLRLPPLSQAGRLAWDLLGLLLILCRTKKSSACEQTPTRCSKISNKKRAKQKSKHTTDCNENIKWFASPTSYMSQNQDGVQSDTIYIYLSIYLSIYHIYIYVWYTIYIYIPNRSADIGTMPLQHRGSWLLASCKDWLRQMAPSDKCDQNWSSVFGKMMHRWKHVSRAWSLRSLFGKHSRKHSRHRSALCTHCGKVMAWMLPLLPPQFSHENSRLFFANLLCQWIQ